MQGQGHPEKLRLPFVFKPFRVGSGRERESGEEAHVVLSGPEPDHDLRVTRVGVDEEVWPATRNRDRLARSQGSLLAIDDNGQPTRADRGLLVCLGVNVGERIPPPEPPDPRRTSNAATSGVSGWGR